MVFGFKIKNIIDAQIINKKDKSSLFQLIFFKKLKMIEIIKIPIKGKRSTDPTIILDKILSIERFILKSIWFWFIWLITSTAIAKIKINERFEIRLSLFSFWRLRLINLNTLNIEITIKKKKFKVGSCMHCDISTFSFHPLKTITTGEGGAVSTNSFKLYNKS